MDDLPPEIKTHILKFLIEETECDKDIIAVGHTSRSWRVKSAFVMTLIRRER
jgi:hypothetical protein